MADVTMAYPIVSNVNGQVVAAHTYDSGAASLATVVNRHAGNAVLVAVGEPIAWDGKAVLTVGGVAVPVNPGYGRLKDPNKIMLSALVAVASEPRRSARRASAPTTAATTAAAAVKSTAVKRATGTRRAPLKAKPAANSATTKAAAKVGAAVKNGTRSATTKAAAKVGATA